MAAQLHNLSRIQHSTQLTKSSPDYAEWITKQLTTIAVMMGEEISKERLALTMAELIDTEPAKLAIAFAAARQECKFFPKPAELLAFIKRENSRIRIPTGPGQVTTIPN